MLRPVNDERSRVFRTIAELTRTLASVEGWLDKAERRAAEKGFDTEVLMNARLAPDMGTFVYQIQSACDYVKAGAAWLSGGEPPKHADEERTIGDVRARIRKTIAFVETVDERGYADASQQKVRVSWSPAGKVLPGDDYLLRITIPNVYFHLVAAYGILRHNGVDVGKMDFLGALPWVDA